MQILKLFFLHIAFELQEECCACGEVRGEVGFGEIMAQRGAQNHGVAVKMNLFLNSCCENILKFIFPKNERARPTQKCAFSRFRAPRRAITSFFSRIAKLNFLTVHKVTKS